MMDLLQALGSGILIGLVYSLLGLCIVIIYKASEAFNFAIGEFLVIGHEMNLLGVLGMTRKHGNVG